MEPVDLLRGDVVEVLHRWRYERCHMSRQADQVVGRLADGRFYASRPRDTDGYAAATVEEALLIAAVLRAELAAGEKRRTYHGPGPDVGEWVEKTPYA